MKIALIGATGLVGGKILTESLLRGHLVTAIVRRPDTIAPQPNVTALKADATQSDQLAPLLTEHDIVISAFNPGSDASGAGPRSIVEAARTPGSHDCW